MRRRFRPILACLAVLAVGVAALTVFAPSPPASAQNLIDYQELPLPDVGGLVVDEAADRVYLVSAGPELRLVVTDLDGNLVSTVSDLPGSGTGAIALSPDGSRVFVAYRQGIAAIDSTTLEVVESFGTPASVTVTDLAWAGSSLWLASDVDDSTRDRIYRLQPASGALSVVLSDVFLPEIEGAGSRLVVREFDELLALDVTTSTVVARRPDADTTALGSTANGEIFVVSQASNAPASVVLLDPSTLNPTRSTQVPGSSELRLVAADADLLATTPSNAPLVSVYDAESSSLVSRLQLPAEAGEVPVPSALAVTSEGLLIFARRGVEVVVAAATRPLPASSELDLGPRDTGGMVGVETTLTGSLVDSGAPVAGATVVVTDVPRYDSLPERTRTVTTDVDGRFAFTYVPRSYSDLLTASYAGSAEHPAAEGQFETWSDYRPSLIELTGPAESAPGQTPEVSGTLTSLGQPVVGQVLDVSAAPSCSQGLPSTVTTGPDGTFRFSVDPGRCISAVYTVSLPYNNAYEATSARHTIRVSWANPTLTVAVAPAEVGDPVTWTGRLLIDGAPSAGTPLTWSVQESSTVVESGTFSTDADGRFSLTRTYDQPVTRTLIVTFAGDTVTLPAQERAGVSIARRQAQIAMDQSSIDAYPGDDVTIAGTLTSARGEPLAGYALQVRQGSTSLPGVTTDANGRFTFTRTMEPDPPPPYQWADYYQVTMPEDSTFESTSAGTAVSVSRVPTELTLVASRETTTPGDVVELSGTLMDPSRGLPLVGAEISVSTRSPRGDIEQRVSTDSAGRFQSSFVAEGGVAYVVSASYSGTSRLSPTTRQVLVQGTPLPGVLTLDGPRSVLRGGEARFTGRITDQAGVGDPTLLDLVVQDADGQVVDDFVTWAARAGENGRFAFDFPGFAPGRYTIRTTSTTWRTTSQTTSREISVRPFELSTRATAPRRRVDGYAVYDLADVPRLVTTSTPPRDGLCLRYVVERRDGGLWERERTSPCRATDSAGTAAYRLKPPPSAGRYRVRPLYGLTFPAPSNWVMVRFR